MSETQGNETASEDSNLSSTPKDVPLESAPAPAQPVENSPDDPENVADAQNRGENGEEIVAADAAPVDNVGATATEQDDQVTQSDNSPRPEDGPQDNVSQEPVNEDDVEDDDDDDNSAA